jgi:hypothetical protein
MVFYVFNDFIKIHSRRGVHLLKRSADPHFRRVKPANAYITRDMRRRLNPKWRERDLHYPVIIHRAPG